MVKFDMSPSLSKGKQISTGSLSGASGGDYTTPSQGVKPAKVEAIVTSGAGKGEWAKGGGDSNVGKQSVKPVYPC